MPKLLPTMPTKKKQRRGSVADVVAKFELQASNHSETMRESDDEEEAIIDPDAAPSSPVSCSKKAYSGASLLLGFVTGTTSRSINQDIRSVPPVVKSPKKSPGRTSFVVPPSPHKDRHCVMCEKKIFPTDETTTSQGHTYHVGCFRCSLCSSKMKNHPDEEHKLVGPPERKQHMILQCRQCKIDNEHMNKPRRRSSVAGERIVVKDEEQGDVVHVKEEIGDDLEEAMWGMIPRCAICGGDFLSYEGDISMVGSLKYHKECFLRGKPGAGSGSLTLDPVQASRYLPESFILKLADAKGKSITTLFFVWKDKEQAIKTMRLERKESVSVQFELDEEARANPNFKGKNNPQRKSLPGGDDDLSLELIGGDQIAPEPPKMMDPVRIVKRYQKPSYLQGTIAYSKYKLDHSLVLNIPCNWKCDTLKLMGATLTVQINEQHNDKKK